MWYRAMAQLATRPTERCQSFGRGASGLDKNMSRYYVYVLEDESGKKYKGMTNNLNRRLAEHQRGKTKTTSRMRGLKICYQEEFGTFEEARMRELYFKTAAGRRFLKDKLSGYGSIG